MTSDAPTIPPVAYGDRVRITREGVVTAVWDGGYDFSTDSGGLFTVSNRFPADVEILAPPPRPFVVGDIVACTSNGGERVVRVRKAERWFFVTGPNAGQVSWLLDRALQCMIDDGFAWRVDTDKPAEPAVAPPFALDKPYRPLTEVAS